MALDPEIQAQQDALEAELANYRAQVRASAAVTGAMSANISRVTRDIARLSKAAAVAEEFDNLSSASKKGQYSILDMASELRKLDRAAEQSGVALTAQAQANREAILTSLRSGTYAKAAGDGLQLVATVAGGFVVNTLRTFAKELTSGQGAAGYFNLGTKLMTNNITAVSKSVIGIGSVIENTGMIMALAAKTGPGRIAGAVASIFGDVLKLFGQKTKEAAEFGVEILNEQVQKLLVSFQTYSKAGAVFTNGLADLSTIADDAGISIKNIANFIGGTAQQMVLFGGTVAGGAEKIGKVNKQFVSILDTEGRSLRTQLGNLGISIEDQMSITADYLEMLARGGRLRGKEDAEVAKEAFAYAKSLKVISSITGEDAKKAQQRAKQALSQSYVQASINRLGGDAAAKFKLGVAGLPEELQRAVQQMATDGMITDPDLAAAVAQVPALQQMLTQIAAGIRDQSVAVPDFTASLTTMSAELSPIIKAQVLAASDGVGRANLLLGKFAGMESIFQALLNMGTAAAEGGKAQQNAQTVVESAAKVTDKLTTVVGNAETQFEIMARRLEKDLNPAIVEFAKFVSDQISISSKAINAIIESILGPSDVTRARNAEIARQVISPEESAGTPTIGMNEILGTPPAAPARPTTAPAPTSTTPANQSTVTPTGATNTPFAGANNALDNPVVYALVDGNKKSDQMITLLQDVVTINRQLMNAMA